MSRPDRAPTPPPESDSIAGRLRRATPAELALLPIRAFFGATFLYAGLDKLLDPTFFDPSSPASITAQLQAFARVSPLAPLVRVVEPWAIAVGFLIAIAEIAIGLGALSGLAFRAAAVGGAALSLLFFLTASWTTHPYYYGPDLPYAVGWIALAIGGTGGLLVPGAVRKLGTSGEATTGQAAQPEVSPGRRLVLEAAVLAALSLMVTSVAAPMRFLRAGDGGTSLTGGSPASPTDLPATPAASPGQPSPTAAGSSSPSATPFHPSGLAVASIATVDRKGSVAIRVPADAPAPLPAGDPGVIVRLPDGTYVAFDALCTHEGCRVGWDARDSVLLCPCHGAAFDPANHGAVLAGPTNVPLPELPIVVDAQAGTISLKA